MYHFSKNLSALAIACVLLEAAPRRALALGQERYVVSALSAGGFVLVQNKVAANIYVDEKDWPGVNRVAASFQADVARVTTITPKLTHDVKEIGANAVIIGTVGKSELIDRLAREKKIDVSGIAGKWESFFIQVVANPLPGVANALVIAGSDKRGTSFAVYDVSEQIGVSPWYYWADVPVVQKQALFVKAGKFMQGEPGVKYRGIFFNDESPALSGWTREKFGKLEVPTSTNTVAGTPATPPNALGMNHYFYTNVFELLLRLKGNYMWPAMWNNAFNEDDPLNPILADEYGIVMGNSHQEPMLRAQKEWDRRHPGQTWNYFRDPTTLSNFWREGITRNKNYESIPTIGLRGANDTPMIQGGTRQQAMDLLGDIIKVQREMIGQVMNPDVTKVPQLWCPYKEVLDYYNAGFRVPDDVTILWTDDNWGNLRRLPTDEERKRPGGAGIYYHFDYVGGPRNYKWINTNPIIKTWEQMHLAKEFGADRIWIVNVGDLKPLEFPVEFFIQYAWNPAAWPKEKISEFTRLWAEREFGPAHATEIADIVAKYSKYNGRRKHELLEPGIFSLADYQEAETVVADFKAITDKAEAISKMLPENARDAFFQLVLDPTKASLIVNELYVAAAKNRLYVSQGRASANDYAARTRELFKADADLGAYYNTQLAGGKWSHMMDQTHIGYTMWQQPNQNIMPRVSEITVPAEASMGVAIEGSATAWPGATTEATLPVMDVFNQSRRYIDVFNKGAASFDFSATPSASWLKVSTARRKVEKETRVWVSVDWASAPSGMANGSVKIERAGGEPVTVKVAAFNPAQPVKASLKGFVEAGGYVSIEAEHFTRKQDTAKVKWEKIEDYGNTLSAMSAYPVTAASVTPGQNSPSLEYDMYMYSTGVVKVAYIISPSLNFLPERGLQFAVAFDDEAPQIVTAIPKGYSAQNGNGDWEASVRDNGREVGSTHALAKPGNHTLKVWMVDTGVVLEKIIVNTGGVKPSYLGPPESFHGPLAARR